MIIPQIKDIYKNEYAILFVANKVKINGIIYQWLFIATLDGCIYDTIILPSAKYKQCEHSFTIYHGQDTPEVFYRVDNNTP